jgi:hypothetical protein
VAQESKAPKTATKNKAFVVSPARFIPSLTAKSRQKKTAAHGEHRQIRTATGAAS